MGLILKQEPPDELVDPFWINPERTKVFFVTLWTKGGGHFDPLITQKLKKLEQ